jgi:hypothetical protein
MKDLIDAELLKLRTTRMGWIALTFVLLAAAAIPAVALLVAVSVDGAGAVTASDLDELVKSPVRLTGGAVLLVGLLTSGAEHRFRTVVTTRLAEPRPARVLAAKLLAVGGAALVLGLAVVVLSVSSSALGLHARGVAFQPFGHGVPRLVALVPPLLALHGVLGVALGELLRNTTSAVGVAFGWVFLVEGVLPSVSGKPHLVDWLPGGLVEGVLRASSPDAPSSAAALGVLGCYAVALTLLVVGLDRRREVQL